MTLQVSLPRLFKPNRSAHLGGPDSDPAPPPSDTCVALWILRRPDTSEPRRVKRRQEGEKKNNDFKSLKINLPSSGMKRRHARRYSNAICQRSAMLTDLFEAALTLYLTVVPWRRQMDLSCLLSPWRKSSLLLLNFLFFREKLERPRFDK